MFATILYFFIFLTIGHSSKECAKSTHPELIQVALKDPMAELLKDLQSNAFFGKHSYLLLSEISQFPQDTVRHLLILDLAIASSFVNEKLLFQIIFKITKCDDLSPISMSNFFLQLEWLLYFFQHIPFLVTDTLRARYDMLRIAEEKNPLVFHFFKNFISSGAATVAKREKDKDLLAFSTDNEKVIDPMDVFDAIDYFADISPRIDSGFIPRSYIAASLILGTNLKDYESQKNWPSYYFTLTKLCSINGLNTEADSIRFLAEKFYSTGFYEPLSALYQSVGQTLISLQASRFFLDGFQRVNPLIFNELMWFDKPILDIFGLAFDEEGELRSAKKETIYQLSELLSLDRKLHVFPHCKTLAFIKSLLNPSIFLMSPEEAFEIFKNKLFKRQFEKINQSSSKKDLRDVSHKIFGLKVDSFNWVKRLCQSFWQGLLISQESSSFLLDNHQRIDKADNSLEKFKDNMFLAVIKSSCLEYFYKIMETFLGSRFNPLRGSILYRGVPFQALRTSQ